jgi:hypothetical protein
MIECIFTLDYEIYGNGTGSLKDLVYEPADRLREIFGKWNAPFVNFVEVAELEQIEARGTDPAIELVTRQIKELNQDGHETALHLHPQWCNARYDNGRWILDYSEYNLCTLSRARITQIVTQSLAYMRRILDVPDFTPVSFRAGNWLFQPTRNAASVLSANGIKIDSSVFKGGVQRNHGLDYRRARRNGYYWPFDRDVNEPEPNGPWIEVPIHTDMVPFWKMATSKRMSFGNSFGGANQGGRQWLNRASDFMRFLYPRKFDFCRMTLNELTSMVEMVVRKDRREPALFRPIVAIGHTKDLTDPQTVDGLLAFLHEKAIPVSTFERCYSKLLQGGADRQEAVAKHGDGRWVGFGVNN